MRKIYFLVLVSLFSCTQKKLEGEVPLVVEERIISNQDLYQIIQTLKTEKFQVYNQKHQIPHSIKNALSNWQGEKIRFASKGKAFRRGCIISKENLPTRQIITILKSKKHFVMTYNHGGIGLHKHFLFSKIRKGEIVESIWIGHVVGDVATKEEIIQALESDPEEFNTNMVCF
jgi:hypothetical protein